MTIKDFENDDYKKIIYLGHWKNYKVWQLVYLKESHLSYGKAKFVLFDGSKYCFAGKKDFDDLTDRFISILSRVALHFCKGFTHITYTGKWNDNLVWEVWNFEKKEDYKSLPKFVLFNGKKYKLVEEKSETLDILNNFL